MFVLRTASLTMLCLLSTQGALLAAEGQQVASPPNILIILADDLGYSDLGCTGGEIPTPNIDALAKGGARFTDFCTSARCCPTRASLMTGLYPSQAGIADFTSARPDPKRGPGYLGRLTDRCVTLAEALKPAGYACYYVGKWHMHPATGPILRGFDEFYGFTADHSHDQYDKDYYVRLPEGRKKEIDPPAETFYATDVFNDYALAFMRQGQQSGKPWFLFLGHSSPHFPLQAPAGRADRFEAVYARGWDVLREERFERMKKIGLVDGARWALTPRSLVPVDRDDIANGYSGKPNPAWNELDEARRHDLARRMAVFAAMVSGIDQGVGRIIDQLKATGQFDNTLILFLSDNGACYEWGPFGFDGESRRGATTLHEGGALRRLGGPGTHCSYGSGWANLCNTPFRLYKHFTHEGGIAVPLIVHWPAGLDAPDRWIREPAHAMDVMPTLLEAAGARYPSTRAGLDMPPPEGRSLLPAIRGEAQAARTLGFDHQGAHALRQGDWKLVWGKRMPHEIKWELYNLAEDRCELNDLAGREPGRVAAMAAEWEKWARRVYVTYDNPKDVAAKQEAVDDSPQVRNRPIRVTSRVKAEHPDGVVLAQGGREHGYALHFIKGVPAFDVRVNGAVTRVKGSQAVSGEVTLRATLTSDAIMLFVNDACVGEAKSPGLIPVQPKDALSIGRDALTAAGDYEAPNPFNGEVLSHAVETGGHK